MRQARLEAAEPDSPREIEAEQRVRRCPKNAGLFVPGLLQLCRGRSTDGAVLLGVGAAELGVAIGAAAGDRVDGPAAGVPFLAFGDLFTLSIMDLALENQRAARLVYVPQESLGDLARAPFSAEVLSRPSVWLGIAGSLAAGIAVSALIDHGVRTQDAGKRPVLFGHEMNSAVGYPLAGAIGIGLFEQVAIAEESAFRGVVQSGWARAYGETPGWIYASLAFGAIHATNALFLAPGDRKSYLAVGVPFITLLGSYLGLAYRLNGYSLAPSVAIHFWYDLLIEAFGFVTDPKNSPLAVSFGVPF
jgi:membrane protease YdiL (CAAX protease family)